MLGCHDTPDRTRPAETEPARTNRGPAVGVRETCSARERAHELHQGAHRRRGTLPAFEPGDLRSKRPELLATASTGRRPTRLAASHHGHNPPSTYVSSEGRSGFSPCFGPRSRSGLGRRRRGVGVARSAELATRSHQAWHSPVEMGKIGVAPAVGKDVVGLDVVGEGKAGLPRRASRPAPDRS